MTDTDIRRVLVAVDDSVDALRAVDLAIAVGVVTGAELRFVHVTGDGALRRSLAPGVSETQVLDRLSRDADALLRHVTGRAERAAVSSTAAALVGEPEVELIGEARTWRPDLVVIGRSASGAVGAPYVGRVTRHVLEFSDVPVVVVPRTAARLEIRSR